MSFSWLMLPLGVALGFHWARRARVARMAESASQTWTAQDPSRAQAALTDLETQLTLGAVLRKQGQTDAAVRLHEHLLTRKGLGEDEAARLRYELALDHVQAGVVDRAESFLNELLAQGHLQLQSLELLLQLREQSRDWLRAIETAQRIEALKGQGSPAAIAHYHCELAEEARKRQDVRESLRCAELALASDPGCVRAYLLIGAFHESRGDPQAAAEIYQKLIEKAPMYLAEALPVLLRCHQARGTMPALDEFLQRAEAKSAHPAIAVARAQWMLLKGEDPAEYLLRQTEKSFSPAAIDLLLQIAPRLPEGAYASLRSVLRARFAGDPAYRCGHCGFEPKTLFWQCPSCHHWGSIAPEARA